MYYYASECCFSEHIFGCVGSQLVWCLGFACSNSLRIPGLVEAEGGTPEAPPGTLCCVAVYQASGRHTAVGLALAGQFPPRPSLASRARRLGERAPAHGLEYNGGNPREESSAETMLAGGSGNGERRDGAYNGDSMNHRPQAAALRKDPPGPRPFPGIAKGMRHDRPDVVPRGHAGGQCGVARSCPRKGGASRQPARPLVLAAPSPNRAKGLCRGRKPTAPERSFSPAPTGRRKQTVLSPLWGFPELARLSAGLRPRQNPSVPSGRQVAGEQ